MKTTTTRTKPTDKYREFQTTIQQRNAAISALINSTIEWMEPTMHSDRLSHNRTITAKIGFVTADWTESTEVYLHSERQGPPASSYAAGSSFHATNTMHCYGPISDAIKTLVNGLTYLDLGDPRRKSQQTWIDQLQQIRRERFTEEGRRK